MTVEDTAQALHHAGQEGPAALVAAAAVYADRAAARAATLPDALLAAEVDRVAPGWRVELGEAYVRLGPMPCPRCGELCVLIEWPPRRRMMPAWREVDETLAARLGPDGTGPAAALRHHEARRCDAARAAATVDLDAL